AFTQPKPDGARNLVNCDADVEHETTPRDAMSARVWRGGLAGGQAATRRRPGPAARAWASGGQGRGLAATQDDAREAGADDHQGPVGGLGDRGQRALDDDADAVVVERGPAVGEEG